MERILSIPAEKINGFNYQPSYSSCTFETWRYFDGEIFRKELTRGKELFPKMNAVRLWLSWNAWARGPERFIDHVKRSLDILR